MEEVYLKVFLDRSELHDNNKSQVFHEGVVSNEAKKRYNTIKSSLESGYLTNIIDNLISGSAFSSELISDEQIQLINDLSDSITSEVGRALVAIAIMQLTVKALVPEQSVMLHKGSSSTGSFSWKEGISMRSLDKYFITPTLRKYDLVRLNADGFMMTRSLAENYPYSKLYKANMRGARKEWLEIVSQLELGELNPEESLKYLLSLLINKASSLSQLAEQVINLAENSNLSNLKDVYNIINTHVNKSGYKARLFEIAMHSFFQAKQDLHALDGLTLKPLSQMRSANKKHGNIGDIELLNGKEIIVAWDAKYGKEYLRDEIEEIYEKILGRDTRMEELGFVVNKQALLDEEIKLRIEEISQLTGNRIEILSFQDWIERESQGLDDNSIGKAWLTAYVESLGQKRRDIAPIDEPCKAWLDSLKELLASNTA